MLTTSNKKQMTNELITQNQAAIAMQKGNNVADVCRELVNKTAVTIQQNRYVKVEGWQSIATAHGCIAGSNEPVRVDGDDGGYKAEGYVRHMDTGEILSTAWGFVGDDELQWQSRPVYARMAMAQTRAISRACRSAFAHVVTLIDENIKTTPAEEVPAEGFPDDKPKAKPRPKSAPAAVNVPKGAWSDCVLHFGKNKGTRLGDMTPHQLGWYVENWKPNPDYELRQEDTDLVQALEEYKAAVEGEVSSGSEALSEIKESIKDATASVVVDVKPEEDDDDVPF